MGGPSVRIQTRQIKDWDTFHSVFATAMGFPDFYGGNMNAWIDCMTYFDDGMTRFTINSGELLHLEIVDTKKVSDRNPEIFQALIHAVAFVNARRLADGDPPVLALIL